jgi:single-strand selective monofunctional uracil DNA glycosylase
MSQRAGPRAPGDVDTLIRVYRDLSLEVDGMTFAPPVTHVYNPLGYARGPVERFLRVAFRPRGQVMLLGMNPGPWGMAQTGVPFGSVAMVRDWLVIEEAVGRPTDEHPRRPVLGFATQREEVSGSRLWGWARQRFGEPERFFDRFFIANYCPLVFMEASGRNRTPDKLPAVERTPLFAACDEALVRVVETLNPIRVIGIGKFAEDRARAALHDCSIPIGRILHPSPASPMANHGWAEQAERQLLDQGIELD